MSGCSGCGPPVVALAVLARLPPLGLSPPFGPPPPSFPSLPAGYGQVADGFDIDERLAKASRVAPGVATRPDDGVPPRRRPQALRIPGCVFVGPTPEIAECLVPKRILTDPSCSPKSNHYGRLRNASSDIIEPGSPLASQAEPGTGAGHQHITRAGTKFSAEMGLAGPSLATTSSRASTVRKRMILRGRSTIYSRKQRSLQGSEGGRFPVNDQSVAGLQPKLLAWVGQ